MLHINSVSKYYLYHSSIDMRKGFDSLCGLVRNEMKLNPLDRNIYIFIGRRLNQIKLLQWDGDGLCMYHKRLERGTYEMPKVDAISQSFYINSTTLQCLLQGIKLSSIQHKKRYVLST
jgi:transposase